MSAPDRDRRGSVMSRPAAGGLLGRSAALLPAVGLAALALAWPGQKGAADEPAVGEAVPLLHTELESSSPAAGARTTDPVEEIRLRFTTTVQPDLSTIRVTGSDGPVAPADAVEGVPDSESREIRIRFSEPLDAGRYRVAWRTAGPDGHPVEGAFEFRVTGAAEGGGPADAEEEQSSAPVAPAVDEAGQEPAAGAEVRGTGAAETAIRWLFYFSIVGMLGTVGFRLLVLPQVKLASGMEGAAAGAVRGAWVLAWVAAGIGLLVLPARLWGQSVALFGADALAAENLGTLLFGTAWGGGWLLQAACLGLFLLGAAWAAPAGTRRRGWLAMGVAAAGMAVVPGLQGHPWNADGRELALLNHSLHVLAVGTWLGGLGTMVLAGLPALRRVPDAGANRRETREVREPARDPAPPVGEDARPNAGPAGAHGGVAPSTGGEQPRRPEGAVPPLDDEAASPPADAPATTGGAPPDRDAPPLLASMVDGFSRVALGAVTLLVGTGVINAWIHLDTFGQLLSTGYGRALLLKVGVVAGALALGFYNWRNVRPSLRESPRPGLLRIPATLEFLLGLGVLVATAVLVGRGVPT